MARRIYLTILMLLGIGILANAQQKSKKTKPIIEDGADPMPVLVISSKKAKKKTTTITLAKKDSMANSSKQKKSRQSKQ